MHEIGVVCENRYNFMMLKDKEIQTIIVMLTADKVTELFRKEDSFLKFFD